MRRGSRQRVALEVGRGPGAMGVSALSKTTETCIATTFEAVRSAERPRIHLVFDQSQAAPMLQYHRLLAHPGAPPSAGYFQGASMPHIAEYVAKHVAFAASTGAEVEVSLPELEDRHGLRRGRWSELPLMLEVCAAALEYGASCISISDGLGCQRDFGGRYGKMPICYCAAHSCMMSAEVLSEYT